MKPIKLLLLFLSLGLLSTPIFAQKDHKKRRAKRILKTELHISETPDHDSQAVALGRFIEDAIGSADSDQYLTKFDTRSFGKKVTDVPNKGARLDAYEKGFIEGMASSLSSLPEAFSAEVNNGSYYDFIQYDYDTEARTYTLLFRLFDEETGINYHKYMVSKLGGEFVFNDIYIFISGEYLSETMNRMYLYSIPKNKLLSIFGEDKVKDLNQLMEAMQFYRQGNNEEAFKLLKSIEGSISNERFFLIMETLVTSNVSESAYKKTVEKIIELYPDNPSLYLVQSDYYRLNNNPAKAIETIELLESQTGDDFLNYIKGNIEAEQAHWKSAMGYYKYVMDHYPSFLMTYSNYLLCVSNSKEYSQGIDILNKLIEQDLEKSEVIDFVEEVDENGYNEFEAFAKSKAYNNWKKQS